MTLVTEVLADSFGRVVRDLRVSVTDRCNFRCTYCMPAEGMVWQDRSELLTFEEISRIVGVFVGRFGVDSVRLTGGEPTVRAELPKLVAMLAAVRPRPVLAMTTNGATLALIAPRLRTAGLDRVNISLDSLDRRRFAEIARRDALTAVLEGIDAAIAVGLAPVKINCVLMRGFNDDEVLDFAAFGRERGVEVRFIEFMPLDAGGGWTGDAVVPSAEVVSRIGAVWPVEPVTHGPEPAARWRYLDGGGEFGVIPSVTQPFCGDCDRVRITADGQFRTCLFSLEEQDLRALVRSPGGLDAPGLEEALGEAISRAVAGKWAGHRIGQVNFIRPRRSMSQIGG